MINTSQSNEHALWNQVVRRENEAKRRFEFLTGETQAKKFYNGQNVTNVENKLSTFDKWRQTQSMAEGKSPEKTPHASRQQLAASKTI